MSGAVSTALVTKKEALWPLFLFVASANLTAIAWLADLKKHASIEDQARTRWNSRACYGVGNRVPACQKWRKTTDFRKECRKNIHAGKDIKTV
ncbi:hypothetical protein Q4551_15360 [Oceanobacter sp. 5_MG-2023]|uniref:hypothetical protein n=1 Tax=Oceanobacter sp. 5_MG-2023 TaxID=3062645 RepID=UPI0026E26A3C|nr:hypothetical protein [Oceanobacter sp. 5_MG-2023]MDO6683668.1 hypothetical protein [Oceanobacter sp. 5_MG-2023]